MLILVTRDHKYQSMSEKRMIVVATKIGRRSKLDLSGFSSGVPPIVLCIFAELFVKYIFWRSWRSICYAGRSIHLV